MRRFGRSIVAALFWPSGSPAICGVNGTPSNALKIALSCQPSRTTLVNPFDDFANGTSQIPLMTAARGTFKSETPRPIFRSYQGRPAIELENALPTSVDEPVSMLLLQVKEPWMWNPRWNLRVARNSSAS